MTHGVRESLAKVPRIIKDWFDHVCCIFIPISMVAIVEAFRFGMGVDVIIAARELSSLNSTAGLMSFSSSHPSAVLQKQKKLIAHAEVHDSYNEATNTKFAMSSSV